MEALTEKFIQLQSRTKVLKDNFNSFGNYKYRSCEDILAETKPIANELGLYLIVGDEVHLIGDRFYIKATAMVSDGKNQISNSAFAREAVQKRGMDEAQITGSASSYARKYALSGLLGLDDEKDPDVPTNPQQVKGNEQIKRNQVVAENMGRKNEREWVLNDIKSGLTQLSHGLDPKGKIGLLMKMTNGLQKFDELGKFTLEELKDIQTRLKKELEMRGNKPSFKLE
jgi:hypothetical protein